jgi:hypothetical protein
MHFSGRDSLQDYQVHERHKRAVDIFNRLMPDRLIVDYET